MNDEHTIIGEVGGAVMHGMSGRVLGTSFRNDVGLRNKMITDNASKLFSTIAWELVSLFRRSGSSKVFFKLVLVSTTTTIASSTSGKGSLTLSLHVE